MEKWSRKLRIGDDGDDDDDDDEQHGRPLHLFIIMIRRTKQAADGADLHWAR